MKYSVCPKCKTRNERNDGRAFVCRACCFHEKKGYPAQGVTYRPLIPATAGVIGAHGFFMSEVVAPIHLPSAQDLTKDLTYKMKMAFDAAKAKLKGISEKLSTPSDAPYHEQRRDRREFDAKLARSSNSHYRGFR